MSTSARLNRRAERRVRTSFPAVVTILDVLGEPFAEGLGEVTDVSRSGVGLRDVRLIRGRVPPTAEFLVIKPANPALHGLWIRARTAYLRRDARGAVLGGAIADASPLFTELIDLVSVPEPTFEEAP